MQKEKKDRSYGVYRIDHKLGKLSNRTAIITGCLNNWIDTLQSSYKKLNTIPEVWLSVKKTGDKWNCKDLTKNIKNYWGFKLEKPQIEYNTKYQKYTHDFASGNRTYPNGTVVELSFFGIQSYISAEKGSG